MEKFYISTAIMYVNAAPHMGHALEFMLGDAIARFQRQQGKDVHFLTGTDEHGTKIQNKAKELGMSPQELADENAGKMRELCDRLGVSYDDFIRTTEQRHQEGAKQMWNKLLNADVLYEKEYEGLYCSGCEAFLPEKDLEDGKCPIHLREPERLKEKNWFFKLSQFQDEIVRLVESGELEIKPASRRNEFLNFAKNGLMDVSFSRPKSSLEWGIEVPNDSEHVMYVWCDALSNYWTALQNGREDFWPAQIHLIGKDIIRFHCAYWIAMLLAADMPLPKAVWVHGFITSGGQKMSKSLGNVIEPNEMMDKYGVDALRYYLLREIPSGGDGDISLERFEALYRDELANNFGNLVRRVGSMVNKYFDGVSPEGDETFDALCEQVQNGFAERMEDFDVRGAVEWVVKLANEANLYVEQNKPWELAKSDETRLAVVMGNLMRLCRLLGQMLAPIIPDTSKKIQEQIGGKVDLGEPLFPPIEA